MFVFLAEIPTQVSLYLVALAKRGRGIKRG